MLFELFDKIKTTRLMASIILIAVGIVMLICPELYIDTLIDLIGYVMLVLSSVMILDFIGGKKGIGDYISFALALLFLLFGLAVLVFVDYILIVLGVIFGILLILSGLQSLMNTIIYVRRSGHAGWIFLAILSVLLALVGVMIILNPWWTSTVVLLRVIGCAILFSAVVTILRVILIWPFKNK